MAHVVKAPNGKGWECRWSFPDPDDPAKRKFQKQRFGAKDLAKAKAREVEDRKALGLSIDHKAGKETLGAWAERWFTEYESTVKPNTARKSRGLLDATVIPRLGHKRIRDIGSSDVAEWLRYIEDNRTGRSKKPISPATIKHHYLVLSNVLQFAAQRRAISLNPAQGIRLPTNRTRGRLAREPLFLTPAQVADLADALPYPYGLLVQFLAFTGLRVGECAGLNVGDVDLQARVVHVRRTRAKVKGGWEVHTPKSGKARTTPLPAGLAAGLADYLAQRPDHDDASPLWPGRKTIERTKDGSKSALDYEQPWNSGVFYRRHFKLGVQGAGLPAELRLHDLRHSFASICASNGVPAAQVAEWMGHSNEIVTRTIYTHLFKEDTSRYADALSAAFGVGVGDNTVVQFPRGA